MEVVITAITGKGRSSTESDVTETYKEVMDIVKKVRGRIVYGRGFYDGTEIIIQR